MVKMRLMRMGDKKNPLLLTAERLQLANTSNALVITDPLAILSNLPSITKKQKLGSKKAFSPPKRLKTCS